MRVETGDPRMLATGKQVRKSAMACACSRWRNQYVRYRTIPGN
jgi:hypothetical protein